MWKNVRKFGLGYYDLSTMIWNISALLRTLGINIDSRHKTGIPTYYYIIAALFFACYFYVFVISLMWIVFWKTQQTGDLRVATIAAALSINGHIGTVKLIIIYTYRKTLKEILDGYRELDSYTEPNSRMSINMSTTLKTIKKRAFSFWIVIMFHGFLFVAIPLLTPGRHLTTDDEIVILGFEPIEETPNYEISCFLMSVSAFTTCYIPANIASLAMLLAGYTEAQMLALSEELTHLWEDAEQYYTDMTEDAQPGTTTGHVELNKYKITNEYVTSVLKNIVKLHAINITLICQVEGVLQIPIAAEFLMLTMSTIIGLLGGIENTFVELPFALSQVSMNCLTGQWLIDASVVFEEAVYDSKWDNFNVSNRKTILNMLLMSQRNFSLSAGGIATLSFRYLMGIYRMIYSTYTALRSTVG